MAENNGKKPELLAPAGSINVFEKAVEAGADAVYIGAPALNARALSKDFSPAEIAAMIQFAHGRGVKLYLAANSLLKESEIPRTVETLALLEALQPDALIVQDLGIYHLCRTFFPQLRLHASTLLGAHNSLAVQQFAAMGFARVVLARELTIGEIKAIAKQSGVELEVFVHGALCFSYSGLCLFSSYLGGKSGLRGRCVQPCRRRYHWSLPGGKPGYYFSMNDLSAVELVHELAAAGVSSFKIEGRLRSAHYVSSVVRAYRMVIDAPAGDRETLANAEELLSQAMGRKTGGGYFKSPATADLISPYHSGNIGLYLGRAGKGTGRGKVSLTVRQPVQAGDRLRLHQEKTGERVAFTLRHLTLDGRNVSHAEPDQNVVLEVPAAVRQGDSLFKVDSRAAREAEKEQPGMVPALPVQAVKKMQRQLQPKIAAIAKKMAHGMARSMKGGKDPERRSRARRTGSLPISCRVDDLQMLKLRLPFVPELFLVDLSRRTFADFQLQQKAARKLQHRIAWCLPPVIMESEIEFFRQAIAELLRYRFRTWQIAHIGQRLFFGPKDRVTLFGDYTLNMLNSPGLHVLAALQLQRAQLAIEIDRKSLADVLASRYAAKAGVDPGLTLYGTPPLFTARPMASHFRYDQPFVSPKGEVFTLRKAFDSTVALAEKPFSLLAHLPELSRFGLRYGVIDLRHRRIERREVDEIGRELAGKGRRRRLSTFNYSGTLL